MTVSAMPARTPAVSSQVREPKFQPRPERLWVILLATWIVVLTLAPFGLSYLPNELPARLQEAIRLGDDFRSLKSLAHLLSFFSLGLLVVTARARSNRIRLGRAILIGAVGCLLLESAQLFQVERHARVVDFGLNLLGLTLGLYLAERTVFGRALTERIRAVSRRTVVPAAVIAICAVIAWWIIGLRPALGSLQMHWDRTFPLVVGNEIGGARPWQGHIRYLGVYDRALSPDQVTELSSRLHTPDVSSFRNQLGLLAGYNFTRLESEQLKPEGELMTSERLVLTVPAVLTKSPTDGLTTFRGPLIRSAGDAGELVDRIAPSGAFAVEAWVSPDNLKQGGPARWISVSTSPAFRNFTLGQSGADVVFRVRNRTNSANGNAHELITTGGVDLTWQHFIAAYDHGVSTIYRDGRRYAETDLREPVAYAGLAGSELARVGLLIIAVMTIALPATLVLRRWYPPKLAAGVVLALTFVVCVSPFLISCAVVGGPRRLAFVGWLLGASLLVYPVGLGLLTSKRALTE